MQLNDLIRDAIDAELTKRGMSRRALARELGWSQTFIQNRMRGRYPWTTDEVEKAAAALDVPLAQLLPTVARAA